VSAQRVVALAAVACALALAALPGDARSAGGGTPRVWCIANYGGLSFDHRFVALRRPPACVLEIVETRGGLANPDPVCCVTDVFALRWSSWTGTRAVGTGGFLPSVPAQGSRTRARVVLDRPRAGCLNGRRAPVVFTRARIYPGVDGKAFYVQNLPHNECFL
jgi:hypothetical protein